jgi:hypothetical protein
MYPSEITSYKVGSSKLSPDALAASVRTALSNSEPIPMFRRGVYTPARESTIREYIRKVGAIDPLGERASYAIPEVAQAKVIAALNADKPNFDRYHATIPGTRQSPPVIRGGPSLDETVGMGGDNAITEPQGFGKDPIGANLPTGDGPVAAAAAAPVFLEVESDLELEAEAGTQSELFSVSELTSEIDRLAQSHAQRSRARVEAPRVGSLRLDLDSELSSLRALSGGAPSSSVSAGARLGAGAGGIIGGVSSTSGGITMVKALNRNKNNVAVPATAVPHSLIEAKTKNQSKSKAQSKARADADADVDVEAAMGTDAEAEALAALPPAPAAASGSAALSLNEAPRMVGKLNGRATAKVEASSEPAAEADADMDADSDAAFAAALNEVESRATVSAPAHASAPAPKETGSFLQSGAAADAVADAAAQSEMDALAEAVARATVNRASEATRAAAVRAALKRMTEQTEAKKAAEDAVKPWWETPAGRARNEANRLAHTQSVRKPSAAAAHALSAEEAEDRDLHVSLLATKTRVKSLAQWDPPSPVAAANPAMSFLEAYSSNANAAAAAASAYRSVPLLGGDQYRDAHSAPLPEAPGTASEEVNRPHAEATLRSLLEASTQVSDIPAAAAAAAAAGTTTSTGALALATMPQLSKLSPLSTQGGVAAPNTTASYHAYPWRDPNTAQPDSEGKGVTQLEIHAQPNPYSFTVADILYPHLRGTKGVSALPSDAEAAAAGATPLGAPGAVGSAQNARAALASPVAGGSPIRRLSAAANAAAAANGGRQAPQAGNTIIINVSPALGGVASAPLPRAAARPLPAAVGGPHFNPYAGYPTAQLNSVAPPPSHLLHAGAPTPGSALNDHQSFGDLKV